MKLDVKPFRGQHCESTTAGTLLNQLGLELSEPMLFGLGEGLSFVFWNTKLMEFPFIGGRIRPDLLTKNIAKNLGLEVSMKETSSQDKAWQDVKHRLDEGQAVGLKLDCFHLEYFTAPIHFAGHYVAVIGYDERDAFLVDTLQQGSEVRTSLESLAKARDEKGPMSSRNLYFVIEKGRNRTPLEKAVLLAIRSNVHDYLRPPIRNLSFRGIEKAGEEIIKWFDRSNNPQLEFATSAMMMERAGTGGALFRNLYREFLREAFAITGECSIKEAHAAFVQVAQRWSEVIKLFEMIGETGNRSYVLEAAKTFRAISQAEKQAMEILAEV